MFDTSKGPGSVSICHFRVPSDVTADNFPSIVLTKTSLKPQLEKEHNKII